MKLITKFLHDRLHWLLLAYGNALLLLLLGALLLQVRGIAPGLFVREAGYLLLLTTFLLLLALGYDLARWWPFAAGQERLLHDRSQTPDGLVNLPAPGTQEQGVAAQHLRAVQERYAAERAAYEDAHERHLAFIHLWVHNMKSPLSLAGLIAQREGDAGSEQVREAMTALEEQLAKLGEGLDLVLHMARLQEFALDYQIRRVDLARVVREVVGARRRQFIRLGIFPQLRVEAAETTVLSDAKWAAFAIDQVIGNALKYGAQTERSEQVLRITIHQDGPALLLTIADQGPGIPPEDLPRVCEPFFTGENGRRYAGATGVGLWLVKRVVDELGHELRIDSIEDVGTTVTFRFVTEL